MGQPIPYIRMLRTENPWTCKAHRAIWQKVDGYFVESSGKSIAQLRTKHYAKSEHWITQQLRYRIMTDDFYRRVREEAKQHFREYQTGEFYVARFVAHAIFERLYVPVCCTVPEEVMREYYEMYQRELRLSNRPLDRVVALRMGWAKNGG
jgi:hypothetical protein